MIREIQGNLLDSDSPIIAHGVNCQGAFGAGVAGQIAKKWPIVREDYLMKHEVYGWKLGQTQVVVVDEPNVVVNMATQDRYGRWKPGMKPFASLEAIKGALDQLHLNCEQEDVGRVAMPRIGCGLGGLRWEDVRPLIEHFHQWSGIEVDVHSL